TDARRRDPACELAGFRDQPHQARDEIPVGRRRQPLVVVARPGRIIDDLACGRRGYVLELADLAVEGYMRQLELPLHARALDNLVPTVEPPLPIPPSLLPHPPLAPRH